MAAVRCLPGSSNQNYFGGDFDASSLLEISCGVSLRDLGNGSHQDLSTLEVLTSQPNLLNETEIQTATEVLVSFQKSNNIEV